MRLKIGYADGLRDEEKELIEAVNDGIDHIVKITTNQLNIRRDRRDDRYIDSLRNIKILYEIKNGGVLILRGHLCRTFKPPYGGEFYVIGARIDQKVDFGVIQGVVEQVRFCNDPTENDEMSRLMDSISRNSNFVFNLSQFDEFMEVFNFYKELSSELNNNTTYTVRGVSEEYYFAPVYIKTEEQFDDNDRVFDENGIVIGYKIEDYRYEMLPAEVRDQIQTVVDIAIKGDRDTVKKIKHFSDNLYLNNFEQIDERNSRNLRAFEIVNIKLDDESVVITGETSEKEYGYLHLYDMGQKIKLESIENSLRLINQGASGAAAELLEYIIGDKPMPVGNSNGIYGLVLTKQKKYMEGLDESQKKAFLMATDGAPVSLIKGPPGTGKTHVINAIVQYITRELGQKVVISSQTHVAIDNVLDQLMENYDLIIPNRITNRRNKYAQGEIDRTLYKTWATKFASHSKRSRDEELAEAVFCDMGNFAGEEKFAFSENMHAEYSVIGATTTTSAIGGKKGLELLEGYDWLIIDEVSKCPITEVLRYLPYVKHIIMVGDDFQLAPLLEFQKEEVEKLNSYDEEKFEKLKKIYEESVFAKTLQKAHNAGRLVTLSVNYRSVKDVLRAYNIFYDGALENERETVKPGKVQFDDVIPVLNQKDVFFIDVQFGKERNDGTSRYNIEEIEATVSVLKDLLAHTQNPKKVSVAAIFPYAAQISRFQKNNKDLINQAKQTFKSFEIDTVDAFQGKEADIVLVNTVVADSSRKNFLNDFRRINVSMSRARDKLFIFGNPGTLSKIDMQISGGSKRKYFAEIIEDIKRFGGKLQYEGGMKYEATGKAKITII